MQKGIVYDSQWHAYMSATLTDTIINRDFSMFKRNGITCIQIPLYWYRLEGDVQGDYTGTGTGGHGAAYGNVFLANVKRIINLANSYGFEVYLEFHTLMNSTWNVPAYVLDPVTNTCQELAIVRSPIMQTAFINAFKNAVNQLAGTPGIWAWGINEPWYYPWILPSPYQNVDQEANFISIFSQMKAISNAAGYPFAPKFVSNGGGSGLENVFTDDFSTPTHNGNAVNLWASIDFAGFDAYIPDTGAADIATFKSELTTNINLCIAKGKQVWITEFGSGLTGTAQADDYQTSLNFFQTLPIQGVFAWEWCSDGTESNPNPGLGGYNICGSTATGEGNLSYQTFIQGGPVFTHGTTYTASFTITENPAGKSCQFQLQIGTSISSKVSFTSGTSVPVSALVTMPVAGTYNVYVDVYMLGVLVDKLVASSTVTVI